MQKYTSGVNSELIKPQQMCSNC